MICHCAMAGPEHDIESHVVQIKKTQGFDSAEEETDARMQAHKLCHRLGRKKPLFRPECQECAARGEGDDD